MDTPLLMEGGFLWVKNSNYLWILDAGHGGIDPVKGYTTAPKKMHTFPEYTIYEGVINRIITEDLRDFLEGAGIDYALVADPIEDTPLEYRVRKADSIYAKDKRAVYLSIHSNAGGGSGFEIFTSPGQTKSDKIANIFCEVYQKNFPNFHFRADKSDGDADKEADFYVLRKTDCPALLVENLFFDNKKDADFLTSSAGQLLIAECLFECIQTVEKLKPI
jgi:N-acetylmuramoyl-L-alanine amidase